MPLSEQQLAQGQAPSTAAVLYSPASSETAIVRTINICNTDTAAHTVRIFHDNDGGTFDETTALIWNMSVPGNGTVVFDVYVAMGNPAGQIGIYANTAEKVTVTLYGAVIT